MSSLPLTPGPSSSPHTAWGLPSLGGGHSRGPETIPQTSQDGSGLKKSFI
ncbi:unnamed protein product [Gulo gulo]|uniref:Uncharacterized protein n=1 Tax=Gulo gulo TaxID=48420 RepID=A0A9X9LH45_GULGU|nr:unnamed protein product [Gulo gulo]